MAHGYLWPIYSDQGGPRGGEQAFVTFMAMLEGDRQLGTKTNLQLRAMLSLDPLIGDRGYPNLFATGETAGGAPLVDRQHPHDFFMELSARVDREVAPGTNLFLYGGPVAEPARGRRRSCTGRRRATIRKRRSPTTGSIRPTSPSAC